MQLRREPLPHYSFRAVHTGLLHTEIMRWTHIVLVVTDALRALSALTAFSRLGNAPERVKYINPLFLVYARPAIDMTILPRKTNAENHLFVIGHHSDGSL